MAVAKPNGRVDFMRQYSYQIDHTILLQQKAPAGCSLTISGLWKWMDVFVIREPVALARPWDCLISNQVQLLASVSGVAFEGEF